MAQDISGTNLATNAAAISRVPCFELRIAWGRTTWPTDWATQSSDETARCMNYGYSRKISIDPSEVGSEKPAELSITLNNQDQRYSAFNTSSAITASILGSTTTAGGATVTYPKLQGSPVRLREGYTDATNGDEFVTVFSGYIDDPTADAYGINGDTLTLKVADRGIKLVDYRRSSFMSTGLRADEWINIVLAWSDLSANLDRGNFIIPYLWMDNETLWAECVDAAAADGGWFFIDELGVATFKAATWWLTDSDSTTVQATITTANVQNVADSVTWSTLATGIQFEWTPRVFGGNQDLYRSKDVIEVPPGNKTVEARYSYPSAYVGFFVNATPPTIIATTSGGRKLTNVGFSFGGNSATETTLLFENDGSETAYIGPFVINGPAIMGPNTRHVTYTVSGIAPNPRIVRLSPNTYVQTEAQADMLKALYGDRLRYPRMTYSIDGFKAMPWLQLGDLVRVSMSEKYTSTRDMIIIGISASGGVNQPALQQLTAIDIAGLYEYDDYHVIGTNDYGNGGNGGRMWL